MGIPYTGNRDRDTGRGVICQGQNSDTESVENGVSNVMEMEESGSGVGLEVQS